MTLSQLPIIAGRTCGKIVRCHPDAYPDYERLRKASKNGNHWASVIVKELHSFSQGAKKKHTAQFKSFSSSNQSLSHLRVSLPGFQAIIELRSKGQYILKSILFPQGSTLASLARAFNQRHAHTLRVQAKADALLINPTGHGIRNDSQGHGHFGAPRGSRVHLGLDLSTKVGQAILSPLEGSAVNFIGASTRHPMVDITPSDLSLGIEKIRVLYVNALEDVKLWSSYKVSSGDKIGTASDLEDLGYSSAVKPHIHLQIMSDGNWVDPAPFFSPP